MARLLGQERFHLWVIQLRVRDQRLRISTSIGHSLQPPRLFQRVGGIGARLDMNDLCYPNLAALTAGVAQVVVEQVSLRNRSHVTGNSHRQRRREPWVADLIEIPQVHVCVDHVRVDKLQVLHDAPGWLSKWYDRPKYRRSPRSRTSIPRSPANTRGRPPPPSHPGAPWESSTSC